MASLRVFLRGYKYFRVCGIAFRVRVSGLETDSDSGDVSFKAGMPRIGQTGAVASGLTGFRGLRVLGTQDSAHCVVAVWPIRV